MVGITIGLIVAAAASLIAIGQIGEHRRVMLETQVQQDLRAAADLLQSDMRRAGFRGLAELGVWSPASAVGTPLEQAAKVATANPYAEIKASDASREKILEYQYARPSDAQSGSGSEPLSNEYFGIRWNRSNQTLYLQIGKKDGQPNWQPITDPEAVKIIDFDIQVLSQAVPLEEFCERPCTAAGCPQLAVRQVQFMIRGRAAHDDRVVRTLTGTERVRADAVTGACS